jgi:membrane protein implicated in regulation of membrane protease activity
MSIRLLAFLFGWLELGFVLLVAEVFSRGAFLLWSGSACVALMVAAFDPGKVR